MTTNMYKSTISICYRYFVNHERHQRDMFSFANWPIVVIILASAKCAIWRSNTGAPETVQGCDLAVAVVDNFGDGLLVGS